MESSHPPRLGVDLGGTKIEAIVMQDDGDISHRIRCATPKGDYPATLKTLSNLIQQICEEANLHHQTPIGIGTPGAISLKTGLMMNCNSTCLNDKALPEDLAKLIKRHVRIANDADCFALSEASDGAARAAGLAFGVILGTGVGGGLVFNQSLSHGVNGIRGEWGHNTLPLRALQCEIPQALLEANHHCFCGRADCIETWLCGPAFERHYAILSGKTLAAVDIMELVRGGDPVSTELFNCHLHLVALALSGLINVLDPDTIVLGGGLSNIPELYEQLPEILPPYVFSDVFNTKILKAEHGDSGGVRGAAWLWSRDEVKTLIGASSP